MAYKCPMSVPETWIHWSVGPSAFPPGRSKFLPGAGSSSPGAQLQCAGTTTGSLLISLVTTAIDLQSTVLYMPFCKEGPVAGGSSRRFPGCKCCSDNLPHQQSMFSPHWSRQRISPGVPHPKFRPASCSYDSPTGCLL